MLHKLSAVMGAAVQGRMGMLRGDAELSGWGWGRLGAAGVLPQSQAGPQGFVVALAWGGSSPAREPCSIEIRAHLQEGAELPSGGDKT